MATIQQSLSQLAPPPKLSTEAWANEYRWISPKTSAHPGKYSSKLTPWISGIMAAADDPKVRKIVTKKSAQVAYTEGFWNNYLGKRIHLDPCGIVLLFPKEKTIRKYLSTKFNPMIEATPVLQPLVNITSSRKTENRMDYKEFPGGFLSLLASNAPDNVKSISAPIAAVEEPDDCNANVSGQGDSLTLLEERLKTFERSKFFFGGTPTIKGVSRVDEAYLNSDQRQFYIPCHECGESHVLSWDNLSWSKTPGQGHPKWGDEDPDTAVYHCPSCKTAWSDRQKNRNVKKGEWIATQPFSGIAGFYINELYSPFPASTFAHLAEKYLEAKYYLDQGDDAKMIAFVNNTLGDSYEYKTDAATEQDLEGKAQDYKEKTVPLEGLVLTAGIDVQHDRLAIVIRAWGRNEQSWLVWWGEIAAENGVSDTRDPVWQELDSILLAGYVHPSGALLNIAAASIDSSDGGTNDAVYAFVRKRRHRYGIKLMAVKGESNFAAREIVSPPRKIDVNAKTKAAKYGIQVYMVGTNKAKNLISERLKLEGQGPGRMHCYQAVRNDYYKQVLSEILVPKGRFKVWMPKRGVRNEALDCEVYALHAARVLRLHLKKPGHWDLIESQLRQSDLLGAPPDDSGDRATAEKPTEAEPETPVQAPRKQRKQKRKTGYVNSWR